MTPEEEVKGLNKLIRQYETVYRTTPDADQRERVERQLKDLRGYRDKILAVNVINTQELEEALPEQDEFAAAPLLRQLVAENALNPREGIIPFAAPDAGPTTAQKEMFHLCLYARHFEKEFLPFLAEKQLKLDFKYSLDRDGFYSSYQSLQRRIVSYREENKRLAEGMVSRDMEMEVRKRAIKLVRLIEADAARFFRALEVFADDLVEDGHGDGVKCTNCDEEISFDSIEGRRALQGRKVADALGDLRDFALEAIAYLNIPEIDSQENERADRH
jgi:hypothetical protein